MVSKIERTELSLPVMNRKVLVSSQRFDWTMVVVSVWWLGGLFIDGWAHTNVPRLETFFTPWHAVFYSGYLAVALTLLIKVLQNLHQIVQEADGIAPSWAKMVRRSLPDNCWLQAIPRGYELTALGLIIFFFSGIGDMTWHILFGIERSAEALLSPTHLGLALGIGLALSGPLRAAWRRFESAPSWRQLGPAIFSLTFTFSLLTFFMGYGEPLINLWPLNNSSGSPTQGLSTILLSTALMMGFVLLALCRWKLPSGTFTFMLGLNGVAMTVFFPKALIVSFPTAILGGLVFDLLYRFVQPVPEQPVSVRLFAFLAPLAFYILYFVDLAITGPILYNTGIVWSTPFWAGAPFLAGIAGFLISYLLIWPTSAQCTNRSD